MRTAIIHYWIVNNRGGEKVVQSLCRMFPDAVIFTHIADHALAAKLFPGHEIRTTFISKLPFARRHYQSYLPLMPMALEELDLREFDLILSSESGPAKGIIPSPDAAHICYCHSPMRYLWDQYYLYREDAGFLKKRAMAPLTHKLRQWDVTSASRVDQFVANSKFVASRIKKYYRRDSAVVHPPVDLAPLLRLERGQNSTYAGAYLWVGQLTAYKNPELAIAAIKRTNRKLVVIGEGEQSAKLAAEAGDQIQFLGRADQKTLHEALSSCKALLFPGVEDFGIVPVEAAAAGLPVIALGRGGATETVLHDKTGILFETPTVEAMITAIDEFEQKQEAIEVNAMRAHAQHFSLDRFEEQMTTILGEHGVKPSARTHQ